MFNRPAVTFRSYRYSFASRFLERLLLFACHTFFKASYAVFSAVLIEALLLLSTVNFSVNLNFMRFYWYYPAPSIPSFLTSYKQQALFLVATAPAGCCRLPFGQYSRSFVQTLPRCSFGSFTPSISAPSMFIAFVLFLPLSRMPTAPA